MNGFALGRNQSWGIQTLPKIKRITIITITIIIIIITTTTTTTTIIIIILLYLIFS